VYEERHDGPREDVITLSGVPVPKSVSSRVDCKCGTHLYLAVGHVVRASILHAAEHAVELRRQYMCICQIWGRGGSREAVVANTLDTEELPNFQCCATHPRELEYEARQIYLSHHERGRGTS
jgi:hypothetical protein